MEIGGITWGEFKKVGLQHFMNLQKNVEKKKLLQRQNNTISGYYQPDSLPVSVGCVSPLVLRRSSVRSLSEGALLFASRSASSFTSVSDFLEAF